MQIQKISFSAPSFGKAQNVVPKTKEEVAYDTMYDYFVKYYSDCDPDYGEMDDPNAVRNLMTKYKNLAEKASEAAQEYCASNVGSSSTSDDFDVDRCFDVVV
ncbi:MAG: hypothetical protein E7Z90_01470 [Cyanobacteria bacterium SIG29]|nr:hypothetical protein [Cyanobacteria bacterium SIG29]